MSLATVAAVVGIGAGVNSIVQGRRQQGRQEAAAQEGAAQADPFADMRPWFQEMLRSRFDELSNPDPRKIMDNPRYQFLKEVGMGGRYGSGIPGQISAEDGTIRTGRMALDLSSFNEGLASEFIQQDFANNMAILGLIGQYAGANIGSPGIAGQITAGGANTSGSTNMVNNGLNAIGSSLQGLSRSAGAGTWNPFLTGGGAPSLNGQPWGGTASDPWYG